MRILSGIQPSGALHLGNYFGMMQPAIALQEKGEAFFLKRDGGRHHPEIISEVERAAGLDAGQNSHEKSLTAKGAKNTKKK